MLKAIPAVGALAIAAALLVPTVSQAETPDSVAVSYADIHLDSIAGQNQLHRRISNAADVVCAAGLSRDFAIVSADHACTTDAIARTAPAFEAAVQNYRRGSVTVLGAATLTVTAQ